MWVWVLGNVCVHVFWSGESWTHVSSQEHKHTHYRMMFIHPFCQIQSSTWSKKVSAEHLRNIINPKPHWSESEGGFLRNVPCGVTMFSVTQCLTWHPQSAHSESGQGWAGSSLSHRGGKKWRSTDWELRERKRWEEVRNSVIFTHNASSKMFTSACRSLSHCFTYNSNHSFMW